MDPTPAQNEAYPPPSGLGVGWCGLGVGRGGLYSTSGGQVGAGVGWGELDPNWSLGITWA